MIFDNAALDSTAAEILACGVIRLFPAAQIVRSGADGFGFYCDFFLDQPMDMSFASQIEEQVRGIAKSDEDICQSEMMRENAASLLSHRGQEIRAELVLMEPFNVVPMVTIGEYCNLPFAACLERLPRETVVRVLDVTSRQLYIDGIGEFKTTRVYATAAEDKQIGKERVKLFARSEDSSHVALGRSMSLFDIDETVGNLGAAFWPNGVVIRDNLICFMRKELHYRRFNFTRTLPYFSKKDLTRKGSLPASLLPTFIYEDKDIGIGSLVKREHAASFARAAPVEADLPLRFAEFADRSSDIPLDVMNGLFVTRTHTEGVAHVFCSPDQVVAELISSLQLIHKIINIVDVEALWVLTPIRRGRAGDHPVQAFADQLEKNAHSYSRGITSKHGSKTSGWLSEAMQASGISAMVVEDDALKADAAAIEVYGSDALGRRWLLASLEFDFELPELQRLAYRKRDGTRHSPVVIACSFVHSIERAIAVMLERTAGWLPMAFAPEQVRVVPVAAKHWQYAEEVYRVLVNNGVRAALDAGDGSSKESSGDNQGSKAHNRHAHGGPLGNRIHAAETARVPKLLILGDAELAEQVISVRDFDREQQPGESKSAKVKPPKQGEISMRRCPLEQFILQLKQEEALV